MIHHEGTEVDAERIRRLRVAKGWSQAALATRAGLAPRTVARIESGKTRSPQPCTTSALAGALDVAPRELLSAFAPATRGGAESDPGEAHDDAHGSATAPAPRFERSGRLPQLPRLFVGRDEDVAEVIRRLAVPPGGSELSGRLQVLTAVLGWPGVGKTSLSAVVAHSDRIHEIFTDGVLWCSLGPRPNVLAELQSWARALGLEAEGEALATTSARELSQRLNQHLRSRRVLLVIDDVWRSEELALLRVGGRGCATLITTRLPAIAESVACADEVVRLGMLGEAASLRLLASLCPDLLERLPDATRALVRELEGLPLSLQVAGRLLRAEQARGFLLDALLDDLRKSPAPILEAAVEGDGSSAQPRVSALLERSTRALDPVTRRRFAQLAPFAPKPAMLDRDALARVWQTSDPTPSIKTLVDRGLLEPFGGRYYLHALLKAHAESLVDAHE